MDRSAVSYSCLPTATLPVRAERSLVAEHAMPPPKSGRDRGVSGSFQEGIASAPGGGQRATYRPDDVVDRKCEEERAHQRAYLLVC